MFDLRDLSNCAIILLVIMVFASFATVQALIPTFSQLISQTSRVRTQPAFMVGNDLAVDQNMSFSVLPQEAVVHVGDTFAVTIVAANVTDMFGWQVYLRFDPAMLKGLRVSFASQYVFSSSVTVCGALATYDPAYYSGAPLQRIQNSEGWVLAGDCLLGANQPTFNGSGVLCQIQFKAISPGSTTLRLLQDSADTYQTFNLNFDLNATIAPSPSYSSINIVPR